MNLKLIACKVLCRELSYLTAQSPNFIDASYLRQGLHNTPEKLRDILQREIDCTDAGTDYHTAAFEDGRDFDAILLGYGLCSRGICGIRSKKYPIVVPRAHDCATLFLGSKKWYRDYFDSNGGVYWFTPGWIENAVMPSEENLRRMRRIYAEEYGEENADFLIETTYGWQQRYSTCAYVEWNALANEQHKAFALKSSQAFGWKFDRLEGDPSLLEDFLAGRWDEERFLYVPPSHTIEASYQDNILWTVEQNEPDRKEQPV